MKKLLTACAALLLVVGTSYAQMCFDFDPYCDGLELYLSGGVITGTWQSYDCAGSDTAVHGIVSGGVGYVTGDVYGNSYGFAIDAPLDGTMIMYQQSGGWNVWIPSLLYANYPAPCLFSISNGQQVSTITAGALSQ